VSHQECKTDLSQIVTLVLVLPALGEGRAIVRGVDEGEEVGRVIQQRVEVEIPLTNQTFEETPLNTDFRNAF
jgi:hypothetical protein